MVGFFGVSVSWARISHLDLLSWPVFMLCFAAHG